MSSSRSAPAIDITIRPSRLLALFLFGIHGLSLIVISTLSIPAWVIALLASTVITSFIYYARKHVLLRGRGAVKRLQWTQEGKWLITGAREKSETIEVQLLPGAYIGGRWIMLSFKAKQDRQRFYVVLVNDNAPSDAVRRLRVRLIHEKPAK